MPAVVQTGGKVTCRNSMTARNDSDELGLDPVVIHVSQPLLVSLSWCQPLLVSLSWCQPRGVTTRVVTRGRRRTVRAVLAVYAVGFNPVV